MGEKFSWDRLMKRGKGAEEDNTITLVPEKVEGPVAPLRASSVPQQPFKPVTPAAPPVVQGEAPPMTANRAPLVIDWEEFSKEEASTQQAEAPAAPIETFETQALPIENIEPIQVPTATPVDAEAKSGNFWDQLNKQTQEAMSRPTETASAPATEQYSAIPSAPVAPETHKPVVTGWDDVELTPREQTPSTPSESDIMAGTLDANGFQPISTYQRPTEEEIRQKTDAIAQSNAWSETTPTMQPVEPPAMVGTPVVSSTLPPAISEPPVFESPVAPIEEPLAPIVENNVIPTEESVPSISTLDVGESRFMSQPPASHYEVEDPFKPTGNKLLGPDRTEAFSAPEASVSSWNPAEEYAASKGFEKNEEPLSEPSVSPSYESFATNETTSLPPVQEFVEAPVEAVQEFQAPIAELPVVEQREELAQFEDATSEKNINARVEDMLAAFDAPVNQPAVETVAQDETPLAEAPSYGFDQPIEAAEETPLSASEVEVQNDFADAEVQPEIIANEWAAQENSVTETDLESTSEPIVSTPTDFWASIPGAQAAPIAEEQVAPVIDELVQPEVVVAEQVEPDIDADLERDLRTGDLLLKHKLVAPAQLERALARQRDTKEKLGQVLVSMGLISERRLLQVLASQKGVSPWHLEDDAPSQDALQLVSHETCQLFQVLPVAVRGDMLLLAMRETQDLEAIVAIRSACGKRIEPVLADEVRLAYTIDEAYGVARDRGESALEQMVAIAHEHEINLSDGTIVNPERPDHLTALLRELIADAKRKSATSITVGYGDGQGEILYRIHGRLCPVQSVPFELATSVLKTATADLDESRIPFEIGSDYKVAITTGQQGDNFVVTFPQAEAKINSLDELLIEGENLKLLRELTQRPYGLFLITGSVRSSKQATLKALFQEMEREGRVVAQATEGESIAEQINLAVTSESEVIVVGELENEEDIRAAVKAASSGHLILAEVTANDAPTAIQQLISCGADPYLLATILTGVWSQALAPKLCLHCRAAQSLTDAERSLLDHYGMRHIQKVFESNGCETCNHTGVAGQIVLSEILPVSSDVSHLIASKAPVEEMAEQSGFAGYLPMDYDAMTRVIHGDVDFATARRLVLFSLRELSAISRRDTWETQAS